MNIEIRYWENRDVARHLYLIAGNSYFKKLYNNTFPRNKFQNLFEPNPRILELAPEIMFPVSSAD